MPSRSTIAKSIVQHSLLVKTQMKKEILEKIRSGKNPSISFDEWTSQARKQIVGLYLHFDDFNYFAG